MSSGPGFEVILSVPNLRLLLLFSVILHALQMYLDGRDATRRDILVVVDAHQII